MPVSILSLCTCDPGHRRLIATTRIHPFAGAGVPVVAKRPPEIGRRTFLPSPDRQGIPGDLIHVVESIAHSVVETRLDVLARLFSKWPQMSNDLKALDPASLMHKINVLHEEKATVHPCVGHRALCIAGYVPRPDQPLQTFQIRMQLCCLVGNLRVRLLCHCSFSFSAPWCTLRPHLSPACAMLSGYPRASAHRPRVCPLQGIPRCSLVGIVPIAYTYL